MTTDYVSTDQAVNDAQRFLTTHEGMFYVNAPHISWAEDNELNFWWTIKKIGFYMDLGFYGDGTYSYYARKRCKEWRSDATVCGEMLPQEIIDILQEDYRDKSREDSGTHQAPKRGCI